MATPCEFKEKDPSELDPKAIFTISYTSGTTGNCKGTLLSNEAFISAITNVLYAGKEYGFNETDIYISYLPLAHVFDRIGCYTVTMGGASIGFFGGNIL